MPVLYIIIGIFLGSFATVFAIGLLKAGSDADKRMEAIFSKETSEKVE